MKSNIVDSFTDEAFKGNPAGVCIVEQKLEDERMLSIARELNLSETAFIQNGNSENEYFIRFFSPEIKIPLCGHATLASSKVIFKNTQADEVHFINIQNIDLHIRKSGEEIVMKFPIYDTEPADAPPALLKALGVDKITNSVFNRET